MLYLHSVITILFRELITTALLYDLKSGIMILRVLFSFFKISLAIRNLLWFHTNFRIICSSSVKNAVGILISITLKSEIALGIQGLLWLHTDFGIICSSSVKNAVGIDKYSIESVHCFG